MIVHPCIHCPKRKPLCDQYVHALWLFRQAGATSAHIRCDEFRALFPVGLRVDFEIVLSWQDDEGGWEYDPQSETMAGTICGYRRDKVRVFLDEPIEDDTPGVKPRRIVKLYADRLTLRDEPPLKVCGDCGKPYKIKSEGWHCEGCNSGLAPHDDSGAATKLPF